MGKTLFLSWVIGAGIALGIIWGVATLPLWAAPVLGFAIPAALMVAGFMIYEWVKDNILGPKKELAKLKTQVITQDATIKKLNEKLISLEKQIENQNTKIESLAVSSPITKPAQIVSISKSDLYSQPKLISIPENNNDKNENIISKSI